MWEGIQKACERVEKVWDLQLGWPELAHWFASVTCTLEQSTLQNVNVESQGENKKQFTFPTKKEYGQDPHQGLRLHGQAFPPLVQTTWPLPGVKAMPDQL